MSDETAHYVFFLGYSPAWLFIVDSFQRIDMFQFVYRQQVKADAVYVRPEVLGTSGYSVLLSRPYRYEDFFVYVKSTCLKFYFRLAACAYNDTYVVAACLAGFIGVLAV